VCKAEIGGILVEKGMVYGCYLKVLKYCDYLLKNYIVINILCSIKCFKSDECLYLIELAYNYKCFFNLLQI
jgi:hypothetical protein